MRFQGGRVGSRGRALGFRAGPRAGRGAHGRSGVRSTRGRAGSLAGGPYKGHRWDAPAHAGTDTSSAVMIGS